MICLACHKITRPEEQLRCSACKGCYHYKCYNISSAYYKENFPALKRNWKCHSCNRITRRKEDNTPVRRQLSPLSTTAADDTNLSCGEVLGTSVGQVNDSQLDSNSTTTSNPPAAAITYDQFGALLDCKLSKISIDIKEDITHLRECLDALNTKLADYDRRIKTLESVEKENNILKATVADLQSRLNSQEQIALGNELEISGLEETPNENPTHLVLTVAAKLGIELQDMDLNYAHRAGPKHQNKKTNVGGNRKLQRSLVVAFTRRAKRDEFLKHAKARKNLKSKDILNHGPENMIYVNERLTGENRRLFRTTRAFAVEQGYRFCWLRNGCIFIRKGDVKDGSPAIRIKSESDLSRLLSAQTKPDTAAT
ncbi:unnamed protein product [Parnassius mnemosyne]|uniref:PHD-type domain-containing protein n=1 Tax=Parnassius mnemosyne TaxID=213953 RepID=A0AAV1KXL5_9NEOP